MGVHDHHISADWAIIKKALDEHGQSGFDSCCILYRGEMGCDYSSTFDLEKYAMGNLCHYFEFLMEESKEMNLSEQILCDFLDTVKARWGGDQKSDLPIRGAMCFSPERVEKVAHQLSKMEIDQALVNYDTYEYLGIWDKERVKTYLIKIRKHWIEASHKGWGVLHMEW